MSTLVGYRSRTADEPPAVERREPVVWGDRTGPLDAHLLERYEAEGYLDVRNLFDDAVATRVSRAVDELLVRPDLVGDERVVIEPNTGEVRSVFDVHHLSDVIADVARSPELVGAVRQILGSDVYVHQSRVNLKQGLRGESFYWHSDFETWHMEDGMPAMRALSVSLNLTDNLPYNGSLMVIPTSHLTFIGCRGETPDEHYRKSLRAQEYGVPSHAAISALVEVQGIRQLEGPAGSAVFFDSNLIHGSNSNITPLPRRNLFLVYNSVHNALGDPFAGTAPRPESIAARRVEPIG
jgi:ectoine hydroxylase